MYLSRKTYVKNWDHMKIEERNKITIEGPVARTIKTDRISNIIEDIMQWRKANQIHKWFVDNIQGGTDDCKEYSVDTEQLEELLKLIKKVLLYKPSQEKAEELMPNQSGFFFGTENYDDYYWKDLEETKKVLEEVVKDPGSGDFVYQSSW